MDEIFRSNQPIPSYLSGSVITSLPMFSGGIEMEHWHESLLTC